MLKIPQIKNIKLLLLAFIISSLIKSSNCLGLVTVEWNVDGWSKWFFGIYFCFMLLALILIILGAVTENKILTFTAGWRLIIFGFGASATWLIASEMNNAYRGLNGRWLTFFYDRMYTGFWGHEQYLKIFNPVKSNNGEGNEYPGFEHYFNKYLFELIIALVCRGIAAVPKAMFTILGRGIFTAISFRLWIGFFWWWKQSYYIGLWNERYGKQYKRSTFGHILGWIFAWIGMLLVLENLAYLFMSAAQAGKKEDRSKNYQQTSKKEDGEKPKPSNFF